jgi:hypothetical protein
MVTGQEDAFYQMCLVLPDVIENAIKNGGDEVKVPNDIVVHQLNTIANEMNVDSDSVKMAMAIYLLGFNTYTGFTNITKQIVDEDDENMLRRIYKYVQFFN